MKGITHLHCLVIDRVDSVYSKPNTDEHASGKCEATRLTRVETKAIVHQTTSNVGKFTSHTAFSMPNQLNQELGTILLTPGINNIKSTILTTPASSSILMLLLMLICVYDNASSNPGSNSTPRALVRSKNIEGKPYELQVVDDLLRAYHTLWLHTL